MISDYFSNAMEFLDKLEDCLHHHTTDQNMEQDLYVSQPNQNTRNESATPKK